MFPCSVDPVDPWSKVVGIAWKGMEENVEAVDSRLVRIAQGSYGIGRPRFGDSMSVMAVHRCDVLYDLGPVDVYEERFLATVGRG